MGVDKSKWAKHKKAMKGNWKEHASAKRKSGGFDMPGPIKNGVARLKSVEFDEWESEDNGTVDIVKITGVIVQPSEFKGQEVQVSHFLQESQYRTMEECYDNLHCDLRDVGVDVTDFDEFEAEIDKAVKAHRAFTFDTKKSKKGKMFCQLLGPAVPDKKKEEDDEPAEKTEKPAKEESSDDYGEDPFA